MTIFMRNLSTMDKMIKMLIIKWIVGQVVIAIKIVVILTYGSTCVG